MLTGVPGMAEEDNSMAEEDMCIAEDDMCLAEKSIVLSPICRRAGVGGRSSAISADLEWNHWGKMENQGLSVDLP